MTTVRIGGVPEHFNLPWHLALEEGLFEKEGIALQWIDFPDGTGAMNRALKAGELDLAIPLTGGIIKGIAQGTPAKILQLYVSSPLLWGVHVAADSDLHTIDQLQGKNGSHQSVWLRFPRYGLCAGRTTRLGYQCTPI